MTRTQIAEVLLQNARGEERMKFLVRAAWYLLDVTIAEAELFAGVLR